MNTNDLMKLADDYAQLSVSLECENLEHGTVGAESTEWVDEARTALLTAIEGVMKDAQRYRWLTVNAYVGVAPYPKPHEVWCLRLPNPSECSNLDTAIDAAMKETKFKS